MGGMGDIGGGCWIAFQVDMENLTDKKQRISAYDFPGAQTNRPKRVTITFPSAPVSVGAPAPPHTYRVTLGANQKIHVEWDNP